MESQETQMVEPSFYDESFVKLQRGELLRGKIVKIEPERIYVDVGGKTEGIIPKEEFSRKPVSDPAGCVKVGDEMEVFVIRVDDREGQVYLSRKRAEMESSWNRILQAFKKGEILQGTPVKKIKGGLVVDLGISAFLPASHVGESTKNFDNLIGDLLSLKVIEVEEKRRRVVLSRRLVLEEEARKRKQAFWEEVYEGQLLTGTIVRFSNFGAFADVGGIDGLIHISELSWKHVKHPSELLTIGESVRVVVLGFLKEKERIALSLRRAKPDPWLTLPDGFEAGKIVEGVVTNIASRYVFVEVHPGVEGVIPVNELGAAKFSHPSEAVKENEKVQVKILEMKPESRRMLLSLRQGREALVEEPEPFELEPEKPLTIKDILGDRLPSELGGPSA